MQVPSLIFVSGWLESTLGMAGILFKFRAVPCLLTLPSLKTFYPPLPPSFFLWFLSVAISWSFRVLSFWERCFLCHSLWHLYPPDHTDQVLPSDSILIPELKIILLLYRFNFSVLLIILMFTCIWKADGALSSLLGGFFTLELGFFISCISLNILQSSLGLENNSQQGVRLYTSEKPVSFAHFPPPDTNTGKRSSSLGALGKSLVGNLELKGYWGSWLGELDAAQILCGLLTCTDKDVNQFSALTKIARVRSHSYDTLRVVMRTDDAHHQPFLNTDRAFVK